jgi:hypothetical protein
VTDTDDVDENLAELVGSGPRGPVISEKPEARRRARRRDLDWDESSLRGFRAQLQQLVDDAPHHAADLRTVDREDELAQRLIQLDRAGRDLLETIDAKLEDLHQARQEVPA